MNTFYEWMIWSYFLIEYWIEWFLSIIQCLNEHAMKKQLVHFMTLHITLHKALSLSINCQRNLHWTFPKNFTHLQSLKDWFEFFSQGNAQRGAVGHELKVRCSRLPYSTDCCIS